MPATVEAVASSARVLANQDGSLPCRCWNNDTVGMQPHAECRAANDGNDQSTVPAATRKSRGLRLVTELGTLM